MFRSRFNEAFPRGAPHVGPQDIEQGVAEDTPSADVEGLLCALLGLVLNRKKPVELVRPLCPWQTDTLQSRRHSPGNSIAHGLTLACSTEKVTMVERLKRLSKPKSRNGPPNGPETPSAVVATLIP